MGLERMCYERISGASSGLRIRKLLDLVSRVNCGKMKTYGCRGEVGHETLPD